MRGRQNWVRASAPGLPPFPALWFDPVRRQAMVSLRLTTWRSWERAYRVTSVMCLAIPLLGGWTLWQWLPFHDAILWQLCLALLGVAVLSLVLKPLLHGTLDGFLARQVLVSRSTLWFAPKAIGFRSRLYENGVVLWRQWRGQPVLVRFDVAADQEVTIDTRHPHKAAHPCAKHRQTAQLLRAIVGMPNVDRVVTTLRNPPLLRSIPVLEIDARDAARVTMVLMAAASLTSRPTDAATKRSEDGVDIDLVHEV